MAVAHKGLLCLWPNLRMGKQVRIEVGSGAIKPEITCLDLEAHFWSLSGRASNVQVVVVVVVGRKWEVCA